MGPLMLPSWICNHSVKITQATELRFNMTYEHVAILPFLIDDVHLSPADVAERAENPIAWASRRYGQPEHVFRAAGECSKVE